jgi:hypothetical protein
MISIWVLASVVEILFHLEKIFPSIEMADLGPKSTEKHFLFSCPISIPKI